MINKIRDKIYIGNWQDAKKATDCIKFTVAVDSPYRGEYYFRLIDSGDADYKELLKAVFTLYRVRMIDDRPILVHCVSGVSRSVIVVAGYLVYRYDCSMDKPIDYIKKKRPTANVNSGLTQLLKDFKKTFQ